MKELYIEGVANHDGRKPCVGVRKDTGEASLGARAGQAIQPRNHSFRGADAVSISGRPHRQWRIASCWRTPRSETLCMYGTSIHENREIPRLPAWLITGRAAQGRPRPQA